MYEIGRTQWIGRGLLFALLLTLNPAAQVEISSHRFGSASSTFKTSPQIQPTPSGANSLHYDESEKRRQTASQGLSTPAAPAPGTNSNHVLLKTEHGSMLVSFETYLETLKDSLVDKIEGVLRPQTRDLPSKLDRLSACTESDKFSPTLYDRREFICCEGLHNRTAASDICCEKKVVSSDDVFCCSDKIYHKSETNHTACCGDRLYDPDTEICCGTTLYPRGTNTQCCGMRAYEPSSQVCCFGLSVFELWQGDQCCGIGVFHSRNQSCCFGTIHPAYGRGNRYGKCCDVKSYDGRCYKCDQERKIPVPLFDISKRICCDGKTRRREWPITQCCGRQAMDGLNSVCVNNSIQTRATSTTMRMLLFANDDLPPKRTDQNNGEVAVDNPATVERAESPQWIVAVAIAGSGGVLVVAFISGVLVWFIVKKQRKQALQEEQVLLNRDSLNNAHVGYSRDDLEVSVPNSPENATIHRIYFRSHTDLSTISKVSFHNMPVNMQVEVCDEVDYPSKLATLCDITELSKTIDYDYHNVYDNLASDSGTQTEETKPCNILNTFGKPFAHRNMVDARNPTLQMPESDEKMTLPAKLLEDGNTVETHCSSYWDLDEIKRKFKLPEDECVSSSVVEYLLTGYRELPDYAVVVKPFIGNPDKLRVYKFVSDQGAHPVGKLVPVPKKDKLNDDMDMFFVTEGNLVYIYTKSFSGFMCTTCKHSRNLKLTAYLYGSYKKFENARKGKYEVRLKLYIADELLNIRDFRQGMEEQEKVAKRLLLAHQELDLNDITRPGDEIEMTVHPIEENEDEPDWTDKCHPIRKTPIFSPSLTVKLKEIAEQCQDCPNLHIERTIPWGREWYLVNREGRIPSAAFQCLVDITCISTCHELGDGNGELAAAREVEKRETTIIVDELTLPGGTHVHRNIEDDATAALKSFLSALGGEKKTRLMDEIRKRRQDVVGNSIDALFACMKNKLRPQEISDMIFVAMDVCNMKDEIKQLQLLGLIVDDHLSRPTQRMESHIAQKVNQEVEGACCEFETMSLQMNNVDRHERNAHVYRNEPDVQLQANRSASESNLPCRREIDDTMTSSAMGPPGYFNSYPRVRSLNDNMHVKPLVARPEIVHVEQTVGRDFGLGGLAERTPVQEHASMDETEPLKVASSTEKL